MKLFMMVRHPLDTEPTLVEVEGLDYDHALSELRSALTYIKREFDNYPREELAAMNARSAAIASVVWKMRFAHD